MPISVITGKPGAGKSLLLAKTLGLVLERNRNWAEATGVVRKVYSNLRLNDELSKKYEDFISYWENPEQLIEIRDADVFWDEIATHLDASQYKDLPLEIKRWLQQHRKFGIEIYGTTQDFAMIDIAMRRMTSDLRILVKIFGSRDKSNTMPPVKRIWGLTLVRDMDPATYKEDDKENKAYGLGFLWITRKLTETFDTGQEITMGTYPPLHHIERSCIDPHCPFKKVIHS